MSKKTDPNESHFVQTRAMLRRWPYTQHQIDETLDIGLIEGRGKQLLFRALTAKQLSVFAGSGLSMSYGRLSWRSWCEEQQRTVENIADAFCDLAQASLNFNRYLQLCVVPEQALDKKERLLKDENFKFQRKLIFDPGSDEDALAQKHRHNVWRWLRTRHRIIDAAYSEVERLLRTFKRTQDEEGTFPGGEAHPIKFEIAQQLHDLLQRYKSIFLYDGFEERGFLADLKAAWPSALIDKSKSAPKDGLSKFQSKLKVRYTPKVARRKFWAFQHSYRKFRDVMLDPRATLGFETLAKVLLVDERPHAMEQLRTGLFRGETQEKSYLETIRQLERKLQVFSTQNLKRDLDGIRENSELYRVLTPFKLGEFSELRAKDLNAVFAGSFWKNYRTIIEERLKKYEDDTENSPKERTYLTPSSRYLVATYLAMQDDPFDAIGIERADGKKLTRLPKVFDPPKATDFKSRRSIIANRFDPLAKTVRDLGINKYITTNYDFEIERFYTDRGYRNLPPEEQDHSGKTLARGSDLSDFRLDGLGGVFRDRTFSRGKAAALNLFAISKNVADASIFHLHGRATHDDQLVVTERDYMALYLTEDAQRDTVDEGIKSAFAGSNVLFLGLGMEEADLLRPLRQFISNRDKTIGYTSIALMPAEKSISERVKFASALYLRYGVYTVYYGSGEIEISDTTGNRQKQGIDWLHRVKSLIGGLSSEIERLGEIDWAQYSADHAEARKIYETIAEKVGTLGPALAGPKLPEDTLALNVLYGLAGTKIDRRHMWRMSNLSLVPTVFEGNLRQDAGLKCCDFVPIMPIADNERDPEINLNARVSGEKYLGFYTAQLDELFRMTLRLPRTLKNLSKLEDEEHRKKETAQVIEPMKIALNGLRGAFITGALNAALEGITKEHRHWWKDWQESPEHRIPRFQEIRRLRCAEKVLDEDSNDRQDSIKKVLAFLPHIRQSVYVRHWVDNVITPLERAQSNLPIGVQQDACRKPEVLLEEKTDATDGDRLQREYSTGIRAFDTWIAAALGCPEFNSRSDTRNNRRILTVAAKRGLGKGTFLTAFASPLGQDLYRVAFWPGVYREVKIVGSILINLSFSPEVASVFDSLETALIDIIAHLKIRLGKHPGGLRTATEEIRESCNDVSRLWSLKWLMKEYSIYAKRSPNETKRLVVGICGVELLFDRGRIAKNKEIDLFFQMIFSDELKGCPIDFVFIGDEAGLGSPWSVTPEVYKQPERILLRRSNIPDRAAEQIENRSSMGRINIEFKSGNSLGGATEMHFIHFARPVSPISLLIDNFQTLATGLHLVTPPKVNDGHKQDADQLIKEAKKVFNFEVANQRIESDSNLEELWSKERLPTKADIEEQREKVRNADLPGVFAELVKHSKMAGLEVKAGRSEPELSDILRYRLRKSKTDKDEWRDIRRSFGSSRFGLTILMAAAEQIIVQNREPYQGAEVAVDFIRDTVDKVKNVGQRRRDQMILEEVLNVYRRFHTIGEPELDMELHSLIIRHLGVIGTPVTAAVIVRLPEIRKYFEVVGVEFDVSRRRSVAKALTTMAYRGLVFRLSPHPRQIEQRSGEEQWDPLLEFRYALHRVVQTYALEKLGGTASDPVALNNFAPTLYAAMPSAGPRLSREAYRFLRSLMIGLSQYPDVPRSDPGIEPWIFTTPELGVREQALRCALTLARSTFSLAVISRLADQSPIGEGFQHRGHFQTYRVRLRWIVRMAWELLKMRRVLGGEDKYAYYSLYRDEIVWLYNELGVVAIAQGSLSNALGYLRQAAQLNEPIEGRSTQGPQFNHIDLNHAIVQIERGQLASARSRLQRVIKATSHRKWKVHWTAKGYLCLLNHISGQTRGLSENFKDVVEFFKGEQEDRAAAIFSMHYGRFLSMVDEERSSFYIDEGLRFAETGGHDDIRQHLELASVKGMIDRENAGKQPGSIIGYAPILEKLDSVDQYAKQMGIWSLQCDSIRLRAEVLLKQGETTTAGRLLSRSMSLASRNSMNLRLNSAMTLYAKTLLERGDVEGATMFARASLDRAKVMGYNLETPKATSVLDAIIAHQIVQ